MDVSTAVHASFHTRKSTKAEDTRAQSSARPRTSLGELSVNEQRCQSQSQGSCSSRASQHTDSSPSITGSHDGHDQEAADADDELSLGAEASHLRKEDVRLLLELPSGSRRDDALTSNPEHALRSVEVSQYVNDIHRHMRGKEMVFRPAAQYMVQHPELSASMRVILVDWMAEVSQVYKFDSETLHLAVNYVDRFLSRTAYLGRSRLQLLGTAALLVAMKYEEIHVRDLEEFVHITADTYTQQQLIHMEFQLLRVLRFRLATPTSNSFLRLFMSVHLVCAITQNLSLYLLELSLLEMHPFLDYTASMMAAAALCLANFTINRRLWPGCLADLTGYLLDDITPCMSALHKLHLSTQTHPQQVIRNKFKRSKFCHVSSIFAVAELPSL
ncbi:cyclin-A1 isoform X2 [Dunckerocampus dactyliophorus]|nr:cyclin-A1 isoform X2 [Dunckerocampus dactyliophorus]